jgi:hypothetical protein
VNRPPAPNREQPGHERSDVRIGPIAIAGLGLALLAALAGGITDWMFRGLDARSARNEPPPPPLAQSRESPPPPWLQSDPKLELAQARARERAFLDGYAWVDRSTGVVRIPVERALELVLKEGLAPLPAPPPKQEGEQR